MMNPIIQIHQGLLRGVCETNVNNKNFIVFRGIPYAKPPTGQLRFKDPEPLEPWSGVKDATNFGDQCVQRDFITQKIFGSDDCLYLNVYTTSLNPPAPRAVMVWIHGGAFVCGSGDDDRWGPDYLIEKDIILVTINYRLGILGFLNIEDIEAPGNQGLKDQVQALKWIQQNISSFGGDPNNVTIFGQSAGGASVHYLTISALAQGLFHKAIIQSGVAINPWASVPYSPSQIVQRLLAIVGKDISDPIEMVDYLRTLDANRLIEVESQIDTNQDKIRFIHGLLPSVDAKATNPFLPIPVDVAAQAGIKVPCICGYVSHEGITVAAYLNDEKLAAIDANPETLLVHPNIERFLKERNITGRDLKTFYFGDEKISTNNIGKVVDVMSVLHITIGIHRVLEIQMNKVSNVPTYLYKFEYNKKNSLMKKFLNTDLQGTSHSDELEFLFYPKLYQVYGRKAAAPDSIEHLLIQRFTELWSSFAKTGNPIPETTELTPVSWEPVDNSTEYNCLNITENLSMGTEINVLYKLGKDIKN